MMDNEDRTFMQVQRNAPNASSGKPDLSVIIPMFNERESLPVLLERLSGVLASFPGTYELLINDDDSPDGTRQVTESYRRRCPRLRVIRCVDGEKGPAPAVVSGWRAARRSVLAVMGADLQRPPELLVRMIEAFGNASVALVIVGRHLLNGQELRWNPIRKWIWRGASNLAQAMLPLQAQHATNPMSGYFMLRRSVVDGAALQPKGCKILLEILGRGRYDKVIEMSYRFGKRHRGSSKPGAGVMRDYPVRWTWTQLIEPQPA